MHVWRRAARRAWETSLKHEANVCWACRQQSSWTESAQLASRLIRSQSNDKQDERLVGISVDPLRVVAKEMRFLSKNMRQLLGSGHPMLESVARYYAAAEGKHIRPLLVLLMSHATAAARKPPTQDIDQSLSPSEVLMDCNPAAPASVHEDFDTLPSQRRLAEITELIHTASLLHDDVIDDSTARRGKTSVNIAFGNKMAILAGDFLLGRASVSLARLRNAEVIELLATVIANLVEGEFMQLKNTTTDELRPQWSEEVLRYYLQKTYLKSASLISKSCRAAAILGGSNADTVDAAYAYGRNLGLAFQLVDDMLDYTNSTDELGKPAGADLELGLATAPLLFAWKHNPDLGLLVGRRFAEPGDVQAARELVRQSDGLSATRMLAQQYADQAKDAISGFPGSEAKDALMEMCAKTMNRQH